MSHIVSKTGLPSHAIVSSQSHSHNITGYSWSDQIPSIYSYPEYSSKEEFVKKVLIQFFTDSKCLINCQMHVIVDLEIKSFVCPLVSKGTCPKGGDMRIAAITKYKELFGEEALFDVLL